MIKKNLQDSRSTNKHNSFSQNKNDRMQNPAPFLNVQDLEKICQQKDHEIQQLTSYYERELQSLRSFNQNYLLELQNQFKINQDLQTKLDEHEFKDKQQDGQIFDDILYQFKQERNNFDSQQKTLKQKYEKSYFTPNKNLNVNNLLSQSKQIRLTLQNENISPQLNISQLNSNERDSFKSISRNKSLELRHGRVSRPALSLNDINLRSVRQYTEYIECRAKSPPRIVIQSEDQSSDLIKQEYEYAQSMIKQEYEYTQSMINQIEQEVTNLQQDMIHLEKKSSRSELVVFKEGQALQLQNVKKRISFRVNKLEQLMKRAAQQRNQINSS